MNTRAHTIVYLLMFFFLFLVPSWYSSTENGWQENTNIVFKNPLLSTLDPSSFFKQNIWISHKQVYLGQSFVVKVQDSFPMAKIVIQLHDTKNVLLFDTPAFPQKDSYYYALVPVDIALEPGMYTLSVCITKGSLSEQFSFSVRILKTNFLEERVYLNYKNTAIRTDYGPQRMQQIKTLNTILAHTNLDAIQFLKPHSLPLEGKQLRRTSHFGENRTYIYSNGITEKSCHYGIDFAVPIGTPVYATGDGMVVMAEQRISTGNTIVIEHFPGLYSLFYHLDSIQVQKGDFVLQKSLIGHSGNTGLSTGPHLHIEFRLSMIPISPDWFFNNFFNEKNKDIDQK